MIDAMMELLDSHDGRPHHLAGNIDPNNQQNNEDDNILLEETNPLDTSDLPPEAFQMYPEALERGSRFLKPLVIAYFLYLIAQV